MTPGTLIEKMQAAGFTIRADGGDLIIHPPGKLTPDQREFILSHKKELVEYLAANDAAEYPIYVEVYTPTGNLMTVRADTPEQADFIREMNPRPPPG